MTLEDVIKCNLPRMVINFKTNENGEEQFEWGLVGKMSVLSLIGAIVEIQNDMLSRDIMGDTNCDQKAVVIAFDEGEPAFFVHHSFPLYPIVGMLESIKAVLINSRFAQQSVQRNIITPASESQVNQINWSQR